MEVLQFVPQLVKALWSLKLMYDQHVDNKIEIEELQSFIRDYDQQIPALQMRFKEGGGNVMGMVALKNVEKEVVEATKKLERWSRDKSFFRVFTSMERMQELGELHSSVMACVQRNVGIASLSTILDVQATQASILDSHAELKSLLITSIVNKQGVLPAEVREEVVEASTSSFGDPKFWEDILAVVDNHQERFLLDKEKNAYEDPITTNLMIDPVVGSDGNTYCRWTIIDNNLTLSPFNVDENLTIVIDNLHVRRGLFEKFPEQSQIFRQRRDEYRSCAFSLKAKGLLGDAALALHHVHQWDKRDKECIEALEQVQGALEEAKEKYLQASPGPSNKMQSEGAIVSSLHEVVVEPLADLDGAFELILDISNSILEVRHHALYGISHWLARSADFRKHIFEKGGVRLLSSLLPSSDQIIEGLALSIFLHLSFYSQEDDDKLYNFEDALHPLSLVLKAGSDQACEQAAQIMFNLSEHGCIPASFPWNLELGIENPGVLGALVYSLGNHRPLQVQQIVASALHNLFTTSGFVFMKKAAEAGIVSILVGHMTKFGLPLEEGLPLLYDFPANRLRACAQPSLWLDLVASSEVSVDHERAAYTLCRLCQRNEEYRQQAIKSLVLEQFYKLVHSNTIKKVISVLARPDSKPDDDHIWELLEIPMKKWWSPTEEGKGESVGAHLMAMRKRLLRG